MEKLEVYDLKNPNCPTWVKNKFYGELEKIKQSNYSLKNNYIKYLKLDKMLSFNIIVNDKDRDIICFSGLQINSWPYDIARVSARHYMNKNYATRFLRKRLNWKICVIEQIKKAKEHGIDKIFFSTELMNEKIFKLQCKNSTLAINTIFPEVKIIPLNGLYDTTNNKDWQKIGQLIINDNIWDFPLERKKFKDTKKKI